MFEVHTPEGLAYINHKEVSAIYETHLKGVNDTEVLCQVFIKGHENGLNCLETVIEVYNKFNRVAGYDTDGQ